MHFIDLIHIEYLRYYILNYFYGIVQYRFTTG